jgi:hypothetical protein
MQMPAAVAVISIDKKSSKAPDLPKAAVAKMAKPKLETNNARKTIRLAGLMS